MSDPVINPDPPAPIGPPRSDRDALWDAWLAATPENQNWFLREIGCRFVTRAITVAEVDLNRVRRTSAGG